MNIYVGNLSYEVTEDDLRTEFAAFGDVSSVNIIKDKYSGQSKGFAFIEMPVLSQGQTAINTLNGKKLRDRAITVTGARERTTNSRAGGNRSYGKGGGRGGFSKGGSSRGNQKRYW